MKVVIFSIKPCYFIENTLKSIILLALLMLIIFGCGYTRVYKDCRKADTTGTAMAYKEFFNKYPTIYDINKDYRDDYITLEIDYVNKVDSLKQDFHFSQKLQHLTYCI